MTLVKADPENFEEVGVFEVPVAGIAQAGRIRHRRWQTLPTRG